MQKAYFTLLVIIPLLVATLAIPEVGIFTLIFTLGLAPALIVPLLYLFIGLLIMLPAVWYWNTLKYRVIFLRLGLIVCLVLWGLVTYVPQLIADTSFEQDLAARDDITASKFNFVKPIGIEIHRRANRNSNLYMKRGKADAFYGSHPCFEICERLLTGGNVAWIRVVLIDDAYGNSRQQTHAMLKPGNSKVCREVNSDFKINERCALFAPDHGLSADLIIILDEKITNNHIKHLVAYQPIGYRTANAYIKYKQSRQILFRYSQLFYERPTGRISYEFGFSGSTKGLAFMRERRASKPIDLADAMEKIGLALGPIRLPLPKSPGTERNHFVQAPPDAQDAAYAASLIATGPEIASTYSNSFANVVNHWHSRLRWKAKLSSAERAIFCTTLADTRIQRLFWKDQVIRKHAVTCS